MLVQKLFHTITSGLLLFVILPISLRAASVSIPSFADTYVSDLNPISNFGTGGFNELAAGSTGSGDVRRALYKFDIAANVPANATITSVTLTLQAIKTPQLAEPSTFDLRTILGAWTESGVTWNSAPGFSGTPSATIPVTGVGSYVFGSTPEMIADVQSWLNNPGSSQGWMLVSEDELSDHTARRWGARDGASPPSLVVNYSTAAPPPTAPTLTQISATNNLFNFIFAAEANRTYAAEFRGVFTNSNWTVLSNISAQAVATNIFISDPLTSTQRFYRVRTP